MLKLTYSQDFTTTAELDISKREASSPGGVSASMTVDPKTLCPKSIDIKSFLQLFGINHESVFKVGTGKVSFGGSYATDRLKSSIEISLASDYISLLYGLDTKVDDFSSVKNSFLLEANTLASVAAAVAVAAGVCAVVVLAPEIGVAAGSLLAFLETLEAAPAIGAAAATVFRLAPA